MRWPIIYRCDNAVTERLLTLLHCLDIIKLVGRLPFCAAMGYYGSVAYINWVDLLRKRYSVEVSPGYVCVPTTAGLVDAQAAFEYQETADLLGGCTVLCTSDSLWGQPFSLDN